MGSPGDNDFFGLSFHFPVVTKILWAYIYFKYCGFLNEFHITDQYIVIILGRKLKFSSVFTEIRIVRFCNGFSPVSPSGMFFQKCCVDFHNTSSPFYVL